MDGLASFARQQRWVILAGLDILVWVASFVVAAVLRFEIIDRRLPLTLVLGVAVVAAAAQVMIATVTRLYESRHRVGSVDDAVSTFLATLLAGTLATVLVLAWPGGRLLPLSVPVVATVFALIGTTGGRLLLRRLHERTRRPSSARRALVVGAGDVGSKLVSDMLTDPDSPYLPVAFVDDDPAKSHLRVSGVRVRGRTSEVDSFCRALDVDSVVVAVANPSSTLLRRVSDQAAAAGVTVKVLPTLTDLFSADVSFRDLRDIELADLLGRHVIETDVESIAGYLTNRRVLVTGAGGSIGSELCRQISRFGPEELVMLDRDESALHATQLTLNGRALLDTPDVVLADIRDAACVRRLFLERRPDVVFHAAALKHLPMLEQYPDEAWKTNVLGSLHVLDAAREAGVGVFVNISTDKAADPTSVLGYSKRVAERLTAAVAHESPGRYVSVRFGNVIGSRGSVLTAFAEQITRGGPVTVTHPEVTRYFMTVGEAVQLVIQAAAIGRDGEALVLDMGEPVRILDVARQLITMAGRDVDIVFTGLRPGEKMHEQLMGAAETGDRPIHPLVTHVAVPRQSVESLSHLRKGQLAAGAGEPTQVSAGDLRRWSEEA